MLVTKDWKRLFRCSFNMRVKDRPILTIFCRITAAAYHGEDCSICGHFLKSPGLSTKISRIPLTLDYSRKLAIQPNSHRIRHPGPFLVVMPAVFLLLRVST